MGTKREEHNQELEPDYAARLRLYARRRVLWLRHLWTIPAADDGDAVPAGHAEVDRILMSPQDLADAERRFHQTDAQAQALTAGICEIDARCALDPTLGRLRGEFGLTGMEIDLLTAAAAADQDPSLRRLYGYLNDDTAACGPSIAMTAALFGWPISAWPSPNLSLVRWRMARPSEQGHATPTTAEWTIDPAIGAFLAGRPTVDSELGSGVAVIATTGAPRYCLFGDLIDAAESFAESLGATGTSTEDASEHRLPERTRTSTSSHSGAESLGAAGTSIEDASEHRLPERTRTAASSHSGAESLGAAGTRLGDASVVRLPKDKHTAALPHSDHGAAFLEVELVGTEGSGKRTLAAQWCARRGVERMLVADAGALLSKDVDAAVAVERAVRIARLQKLLDGALYWKDADLANPKIWPTVRALTPWMILGTSTASVPKQADLPRLTLRLPPLTRTMRRDLWQSLSPLPPPIIVEEWMLTPADITAAVSAAPAGAAAVHEACRRNLNLSAGGLGAPLARPYTKDDLVLSDHIRTHIAELEAQARHRWGVYEEWGFQRLCPMGRGITALFSGPSGTGKTMAAQVLARTLDMELYRVDLANVVSKYIGETEKNLKSIFDACDRANVLLFFDEADALFGQRTQVKDAHDRFANIEIDYLLQRMELFDGIAVLATNRKADLDQAFLRRIRFIIDFMPPGAEERLILWKKALPEKMPGGARLAADVEWKLLADKLPMNGAEIKAAALGAAFLARAEESSLEAERNERTLSHSGAECAITMAHIVHAARRELAKRGVTIRETDLV